jgi:DNA-damage-inducible protein J
LKTQATINVEETNYNQAKDILDQMGLSYSQAISIFNSMVVMNKGLPFEVKLPSEDTKEEIKELKKKKDDTYTNANSLFNGLDS